MIRLTIELEDIDFDVLIEHYLPVIGAQLRSSGNPLGALLSNGASASVAKGMLRALSPEKRNSWPQSSSTATGSGSSPLWKKWPPPTAFRPGSDPSRPPSNHEQTKDARPR